MQGYHSHTHDLQCQRTVALDAFFAEIVQEPVNLAMIGAGCSVATEPIAEVSQYYNIVHVSKQICITLNYDHRQQVYITTYMY